MNQLMKPIIVFKSDTIAAGTSISSEPINLAELGPNGAFSLQDKISGSGVVKYEFEVSNDGEDYVNKGEIVADRAAGVDLNSVPCEELCAFMRIIATETGGTNDAVIEKATLLIQ